MSANNNEEQALLGHRHPNGNATKSKNTTKNGLLEHLHTNVDSKRADIPLIISFFIAGMIDAGAYNAYECFCSMQVRHYSTPSSATPC